MSAPDTIIWIIEETLSDGSTVYNVKLPSEELPAITSDDATDLAYAIAVAINEHTNNKATVMET